MRINSRPIVPLGVVHNYKQKWEIIDKITVAWKNGELDLWGYNGERGAELLPVPRGYSLCWYGGPGRERGDNPDFPGVSYYCDVKAEILPREDAPGLSPSDQAKPKWTDVQIREQDLKRLHAQLPNLVGAGEEDLSPQLMVSEIETKERAPQGEEPPPLQMKRERKRIADFL